MSQHLRSELEGLSARERQQILKQKLEELKQGDIQLQAGPPGPARKKIALAMLGVLNWFEVEAGWAGLGSTMEVPRRYGREVWSTVVDTMFERVLKSNPTPSRVLGMRAIEHDLFPALLHSWGAHDCAADPESGGGDGYVLASALVRADVKGRHNTKAVRRFAESNGIKMRAEARRRWVHDAGFEKAWRNREHAVWQRMDDIDDAKIAARQERKAKKERR